MEGRPPRRALFSFSTLYRRPPPALTCSLPGKSCRPGRGERMFRKALVLSLVLAAAATGPVRADEVRDIDHITFAALNTQGQEGVVESSITFLANVNMETVLKHMLDKDVLSKIAP